MYKTKFIIPVLALVFGCCQLLAQPISELKLFEQLEELANASINVGNPKSIDSIILLCEKLEPTLKTDKERFVLRQIKTNSFGMKGDMQGAVSLAEQMYKEAEEFKDKQMTALALQALGDTYLHSGQYERALRLFEKAEQEMKGNADSLLMMRLLFQQLHTALCLKDTLSSVNNIKKIGTYHRQLLPDPSLRTLLLCYQTWYDILTGNVVAASEKVDFLVVNSVPKRVRKLYLEVLCHYFILEQRYPEAKSLIDSVLSDNYITGNGIEKRNLLLVEAKIFELQGENDEACSAYLQAKKISDSVNVQRYAKSLETLRMSYATSQMKLENISAHHNLIVRMSVLVCIALIFAIVLIVLIWRKNMFLERSRRKLLKDKENAEASIYAKSLFLSNMSHDLRAPLGAIVGFANLLTDSEEVDDELRHASGGYIKQSSELLLKLVHDIEDISALSENKMKFDFAPCDVILLCRNVIDTVKQVNKANIELLFAPETDDLTIETDYIRLQQVLINLLVNATKFTKEGFVRLVIRKDEQREEATFIIEDTGCGIPLEKQPHIFERFEKLHEGAQGVGLGLSICQLIVETVGGKIWIDSTYTVGARFVFTHPFKIKQTL